MKHISLMVLIAVFSPIVLASCQSEARWYPDAVEIQGRAEYADAGGPKLAVTLVIHNTGNTSILTSTVTVKAVTNKREYLQTAGSTGKIIPGGKAALTITVAYLEADEAVQPDGVSVYNAYFD